MTDQFFDPSQDADGPKIYVGAHIPLKLYNFIVAEAARAMVTRSDVLRWALADRYKKQRVEQVPHASS